MVKFWCKLLNLFFIATLISWIPVEALAESDINKDVPRDKDFRPHDTKTIEYLTVSLDYSSMYLSYDGIIDDEVIFTAYTDGMLFFQSSISSYSTIEMPLPTSFQIIDCTISVSTDIIYYWSITYNSSFISIN